MAKYLNLQVPSSCHENWNNMVPEQRGRYCFSCQKSVEDFTGMTDSELIQYFKAFNGPTCGRFTQSQLNRDIPLPRKPIPWIKYFFKFSLPAFLLSLKSSVQAQHVTTPIEVIPARSKAVVMDSTRGTLPITGVVLNEAGVPLPGASIYIKGIGNGTVSDAQGRFILHDVVVPLNLLISHVGYQTEKVKLTSIQKGMEVQLKPAPALMEEVIVMGVIIPDKRMAPKKTERREQKVISKGEQKESQKLRKLPETSISILAYPNPVTLGSNLNVQCRNLERGSYIAELYTLAGQLVQALKVTYGKEDNQISLPTGQKLPGTYLLKLTHVKSGKHFSQQIIVQY